MVLTDARGAPRRRGGRRRGASRRRAAVVWLLRVLCSSCQLPPMTGATMVGGASGENSEVTSMSVPAAIAAGTLIDVTSLFSPDAPPTMVAPVIGGS